MSRLRTFLGVFTLSLSGLLATSACSKQPKEETATKKVEPTSQAAASSGSSGEPPLRSCAACESASPCVELAEPCKKFVGDEGARCEAVKACVQRTGCGQAERTFTSCYCGDLDTEKCLAAPLTGAGAVGGPCKEPIEQAFGKPPNNLELLTRYLETEYPAGATLARLNCLKVNCLRECSFDKKGPVAAGTAAP